MAPAIVIATNAPTRTGTVITNTGEAAVNAKFPHTSYIYADVLRAYKYKFILSAFSDKSLPIHLPSTGL